MYIKENTLSQNETIDDAKFEIDMNMTFLLKESRSLRFKNTWVFSKQFLLEVSIKVSPGRRALGILSCAENTLLRGYNQVDFMFHQYI